MASYFLQHGLVSYLLLVLYNSTAQQATLSAADIPDGATEAVQGPWQPHTLSFAAPDEVEVPLAS